MEIKAFRATAILVGTTIGAGMFGIPFVVYKIGFLPGIFYLLILGVLNLFLNLIYGEIILRTPGDHQLTGYGKIYLGKAGKNLATLTLIIALYGALLAYLIKIGAFLSSIINFGNPILFTYIFFVLASLAIYFGLKSISFFEVVITVLMIGLVLAISLLGAGKINLANFSGIDLSFLFLPYGVIFFALHGFSVIPEMEEILRTQPKNLKKAIITGSLIPVFAYLLFAIVIVGVCGSQVSDDAVFGLSLFLPSYAVVVGVVLGVLAMGSSYLTVGYVLREVWYRDFGASKLLAFVLASFPALILFLLGTKSFIQVLGITGAVSGGLNGILIIKIFEKAKRAGKRKPAYFLKIPKILLSILFLIFLIGIISPFL